MARPPRFKKGDSARSAAANQPVPQPPAPPVNAMPAQVERQLETEMTMGYRPQLPVYGFRDENYYQLDFYFDLPSMLKHDCIKSPLANVKSPIGQMQVEIEASSSRVLKFTIAEWEKFHQQWICKVQESGYSHGWMGGEPVYGLERGVMTLTKFKDFAPRDVKPLTPGGMKGGEVLGVHVSNVTGGAQELPGSAKGFPAKGFWYAHNPQYGSNFGRSQVEGAWKPYRRLTGRDGVEEIVDTAIYRYGTGTVVVGAPIEDTKATNQPGGPTRNSAMQRGQELGETLKAGGAVTLPTTKYPDGSNRWTLDFEQPQTNIPELLQADELLYTKCSKAIGWPPELTEASDTGSGFSGRMIPLQAFLMSQQPTAQGLFQAWFNQIGLPLIWWNYGPHAWARCTVVSLLKSYRQAAQPQAPTPPPQAMPGAGAPEQPGMPAQGQTEAPTPQAPLGKTPYVGPRNGHGWKDPQGRVHYGPMLSTGSYAFDRSREAIMDDTDAHSTLLRLAKHLPDLSDEELAELERNVIPEIAITEEKQPGLTIEAVRGEVESVFAEALKPIRKMQEELMTLSTRPVAPAPVSAPAPQPNVVNVTTPDIHFTAPASPPISISIPMSGEVSDRIAEIAGQIVETQEMIKQRQAEMHTLATGQKDATLAALEQLREQIAAMPAPVVHVDAPVVNIPKTPAPIVHVAAPVVRVTLPEQSAVRVVPEYNEDGSVKSVDRIPIGKDGKAAIDVTPAVVDIEYEELD